MASLWLQFDLSLLGVYMWEQIFKTPPYVSRVCNICSEACVTPNITLFWVLVRTPGTFKDIRVQGESSEELNPDSNVWSQTNSLDDLTILEAPHSERNDEYPDVVKR